MKYYCSNLGYLITISTDSSVDSNIASACSNKSTLVRVVKQQFDSKNGKFSPAIDAGQLIIAHSCRHIRVYNTFHVLDSESDIYKLYVLLGADLQEYNCENCLFFLVVQSSGIQLVTEFCLTLPTPKHDKFEGNFFMIDGPLLCFASKTQLLAVSTDGEIKRLNMNKEIKVLFSHTRDDETCIVGVSREKNMEMFEPFTISVYSFNRTDEAFNIHQVSNNIIPDIYASILTCMHISTINSSQNEVCKWTVFACTSLSQLLVCQDCRILNCLSLPFSDAIEIQELITFSEQEFVIVKSLENSICVVDKTKYEIIWVLSDVWTNLIIDDFVGNGAQQMLFLVDCLAQKNLVDVLSMLDDAYQHNHAFSSETFVLTDLSGTHVTRRVPEKVHSLFKFATSSIIGNVPRTVLDALQSRLSTGSAMIQEALASRDKKTSILNSAYEVVKNMAVGVYRPCHATSLVVTSVKSHKLK